MSVTNRNPIVRYFITYPHANSSESHPDSETSKEDFTAFLSSFNYKTLLVVEEPHRRSVGNHFHALLVLKKGLTFKHLLNKLANEYPDASQRIDLAACKSLTGTYRYLTQIGFVPRAKRSDPAFNPKGVTDLDPEPTLLGTSDGLIPKDLFVPFGSNDWLRLCRVCDPSGILLNPDWEIAKSNPFLKM